ncbi:Alpha/Beta hydrolase protein [Mycena epipterygia]|nr:Alpha/Beta hydrolase protein [Mycena epipterygia]
MSSLSFRESLGIILTLLQTPFFLIYFFLFGRWFSERANGRRMKRVLYDEIGYFLISRLSIRQLQAATLSGSPAAGYARWAKQKRIAQVVDELGNDARLLWVGARETEYVVLYCHGGAFITALSDYQIEFWYRIQQVIFKNHNSMKLGVAMLQYSLHPAPFPTQLNQLLLAVQHLMSLGVSPANIFLAGDSAGGNLVLQLLSHILHPVPPINLVPAPSSSSSSMMAFRGMCLISPWVMDMADDNVRESEKINDARDVLPAKALRCWQDAYLGGVPAAQRAYIQAGAGAADFDLASLDKVVKRVLITAGSHEVLCDSIRGLHQVLENVYGDCELYVQDGGVHCDPMWDIFTKATAPHVVEERVVEWFVENLVDTN